MKRARSQTHLPPEHKDRQYGGGPSDQRSVVSPYVVGGSLTSRVSTIIRHPSIRETSIVGNCIPLS